MNPVSPFRGYCRFGEVLEQKLWDRQDGFCQICLPSALWISVIQLFCLVTFTPTWRIFRDEYNLIISVLIILHTVVSLFQSRPWDLRRAPCTVPAVAELRWGRASLPGKGVAEPVRQNCDSSVTSDRPPFSPSAGRPSPHSLVDRQAQGGVEEGLLSFICQTALVIQLEQLSLKAFAPSLP